MKRKRTCADCGKGFTPSRSDARFCRACSSPAARKRRSRAERVSRSSCTHCGSRENLSLLNETPICEDCRKGIRVCRRVRRRGRSTAQEVAKVDPGFARAYRDGNLGATLADADLEHLNSDRLEQLATLLIAEKGPNLEYPVSEVDASGSDVLAPFFSERTRRPHFRWESFAEEVDHDDDYD